MNISVFGAGYVGLVTSVCFADKGNFVVCLDHNLEKVIKLNKGQSPFFELGLQKLLQKNLQKKRLLFTNDFKKAVESSDVLIIAIGTEGLKNGSVKLSDIFHVSKKIAKYINSHKIIIVKSTVPVGTCEKIETIIEEIQRRKECRNNFEIISSPEFLSEGSAIYNFLNPDRIIIGSNTKNSMKLMEKLYRPIIKNKSQIIWMDIRSAELSKYAANAMLATKISIMNELSRLSARVGANIENITKSVGSDHRIGPHFISSGVGFGGSCLPKDLNALVYSGQEVNEDLNLISAVIRSNDLQIREFVKKVLKLVGPTPKTIAVWGLSFKPNTDDIRSAPAIYAINRFLKLGYTIVAYDPAALKNTSLKIINPSYRYSKNQYAVLRNADALCIFTDWDCFKKPDFFKIKKNLKTPLIIDGRNLYDPIKLHKLGIDYISIGR